MKNRKELGSGESRARARWCDLPEELLETIAYSLPKIDVCRIRSVCRSWRSSIRRSQKPISLPLELAVPYPNPSYRSHPNMLPLIESTIYHVQPVPSPNSQASTSTPISTRSKTASWGWIVKVQEQQARSFRVINSISCQPSHHFPSLPKSINLLEFRVSELAKAYSLRFPDNGFTHKVVFSSSSPDGCPCPLLMMINAGFLLYLKIGDGSDWALIDETASQLDYEDVTLYKNRFCAVDKYGRAVVIDSSSLKVTEIASPLKGENDGNSKILLVESFGELLLVERLREQPHFKVFKLNAKERGWVEVKSLDDKVMFLGGDCSFCVAAKDFGNGCKGDCILFTDYCSTFTVFNLEDSSLKPVQTHPGYNKIFYLPP